MPRWVKPGLNVDTGGQGGGLWETKRGREQTAALKPSHGIKGKWKCVACDELFYLFKAETIVLTFPKYENAVYHESSDWGIIFNSAFVKEQKIDNNSSKNKII